MKRSTALGGLALCLTLISGVALAQEPSSPRLAFEGDMVRGGGPTATGPACVLTSQFHRNERVVWRVRVVDPATGANLGSDALKSLTVELPDGTKLPMAFGGHPARGEPTDHFWATSWEIPKDYPTGSFAYRVVATDPKGQEHVWRPFKIASSELAVLPAAPTKK